MAALLIGLTLAAATGFGAASGQLEIVSADRILIVSPHPDDETLGLGGLIQTAIAKGARVKVLYMTNGEFNEISSITYQIKPLLVKSDFIKNGKLRKKEAAEAMALLGLKAQDLIFMGYPDLGALKIWEKHWGSAKPYRSLISRINKVLTGDDFSYGHYHKGEAIVDDFETVILDYRPTRIFVTAPFDMHMDHQAAYLFVKTALLNLSDRLKTPPTIYLYLIHARGWPRPKKLATDQALDPPPALAAGAWKRIPLSASMIANKIEAILKYRTQIAYSRNFLLSMARPNELCLEEKDLPALASGQSVGYRFAGGQLKIEIPLRENPEQMGEVVSDLFGYRAGTLFEKMPKLRLRFFGNDLKVKNGRRVLRDGRITHALERDRLVVRMPADLLEGADRLFVSTRTSKEPASPGFGAWRVLELGAG